MNLYKYLQKIPSGKKSITLTLGLPTVLSSLSLICLGFIGVFILGLLLGGGYDIESKIPQLEQVLPQEPAGKQPVLIAKDVKETPQEQKTAIDGKTSPESPSGSLLKQLTEQRELAFAAGIKVDETRQALAAQQTAKAREAAKAAERAAAEKSRQQAQATAAKDKKQTQESDKKKQADNQRFAYSFQVASYKDKTYADRFTATLKKEGYRVRTEKSVEKGVNWYRVVMDFTGTNDEADKLQAAMRSHGVSKLLMRSKKAVRGR